METLLADEVHGRLKSDRDDVLVNTLDAESFRNKHIPGSINIPTAHMEEWAEQVLPDKEQVIMVYCASPDCDASPKAAKKLEEMGYDNVYDFEAGLTGWLEHDLPLAR